MYGFAQGMGDFLGDFNDESNKIRQTNEKKASDDAAIEQRALEHLANADDPQIRAAAVTAMLTPKKAGSGGALSKWFGQQRDHPVFDQVHQLVNGGNGQAPVQPFLSPEAKADAEGRGRETGRLGGANQAYSDITGTNLPDEDLRRMAMGSVGAPPSRLTGSKPGIVTLEDGTQVAGSFDPTTQMYSDSDGSILSGVKSWQPNGPRAAGNPNPGATWTTVPDHNSPTGYSKVHLDATGKELGRAPTGAPQAPPNQIFQTPGGFTGVAPGRAGGAPPRMVDVQGGNTPSKTENPSVSFDALRNIMNDVEHRAQASIFKPGGIPPEPAEINAARDREAQTAGFNSYKDLAAQVKAGQQAIDSAVQKPGASGGAAAAPGAPAPARSPATKPGAPAGPKKTTAVPGKLDVDAIMRELQKFQ